MGSTFFALAFLAFSSLTTVDLLIAERQVVTREVRGGYYHPAAYLLSKLTLDGCKCRFERAFRCQSLQSACLLTHGRDSA
jgi:hypothetical protein